MIGVCIKFFHENYGGMLQAFATKEMLEKHHICYELVRYQKEKTLLSVVRSLPRLLNPVLLNDKYEVINKKLGKLMHSEYACNDAVRNGAFKKFCDTHFTKLSPIFKGYEALHEGSKRYNAVITGSDQLWSPAGLPTNFYNLMFVNDEILKISLASSFGVGEIPWYQKARTKAYIDRIEFISMRENRGSEIVEELTGRNVPTILDPVFYLTREEWEERIPNIREINEPYVFAYFLGATKEYRTAVTQFARQHGMKIVTIRHMDRYVREDEEFGDYAPYEVDPGRFLNFLRNAEYIFTDSFHGTAFSIINEKQFVVFNRYSDSARISKNSRIETLCRSFGLESRRFRAGESLDAHLDEKIDYEKVWNMHQEHRQLTDSYLNLILEEIHKREDLSCSKCMKNG